MSPKKGRSVRKIVPTDIPTEFESWDTAADIQWRSKEREAREREEEAQKQREEAMRDATTHSGEEGVAKKSARTHKHDTEMDTEAGGEVAIVDFVRSCTRLMNILRTRPRMNVYGRGWPTLASSL